MVKLSNTEKYAIQGMLHDKKTTKEIAILLKRSEKSISQYITGELDKIHETIAKVEIAQNPEPVKPEIDLTKVSKLPRGQGKRTMGRTTAGDKGGVAVMTPAASQVGDEFRKEMSATVSRTARNAIYDTEGNKKEN
jgi:hypothetical protein